MSASADASTEGFNQTLIERFRASRGRIADGVYAGIPLLLLSNAGVKSGRRRTTPLVFGSDGDRYIVVASNGGAPGNPARYHNLLANDHASLEVDGETFDVRATVAEGTERARLGANQTVIVPNLVQHQRNTSRQIPVVTLERTRPSG